MANAQRLEAIRIREAMHDIGISATELANRTGLSKASISQYCSGTYVPTNERAYKLASCLGIDPAWLMGFDVPKVSNIDYLCRSNDVGILMEKINKLNPHNIESINAYADSLLESQKKDKKLQEEKEKLEEEMEKIKARLLEIENESTENIG